MRIDTLLFRLRFVKTRGAAQRWIAQGHIRCNGSRVTRQDLHVDPGDVLTLPLGNQVRVVRLTTLPERRGPAAEARTCYICLNGEQETALDPGAAFAIADDKGR